MLITKLIHATVCGAFLGAAELPTKPADESVDGLKSNLMTELTSFFRQGHDEGRLVAFEDSLRGMFATLPKTSNGNLDHATARYALHRLFIERHGWSIEGLEPVDTEREATPMSTLSQWMPNYLVESIEELLGTHGVNLRELAVLAAAFEDMVHRESSGRLQEVYDILQLSKTDVLHEDDATQVVNMYMTMYTSGGNGTVRTKEDLLNKKGGLNRRTKEWLRTVQGEVAEAESMCDVSSKDCGRLDFKAATRVVEQIGEKYQDFNELECEDLTNTLLQAEDPANQGKVKLPDFYSGLHGAWNFTETPDYLRALGALDEREADARLIIPNYVASRPNCLAASSIYVVCCRNPCEDVMARLEAAVAAPVATPEQIVPVLKVSSSQAIESLKNIANNGAIALHGVAFAQWLHDLYPRSCPRPHASSHLLEPEVVSVSFDGVSTKEAEHSDSVASVEATVSGDVAASAPEASLGRLLSCIGLLVLASFAAYWASHGVLLDAHGVPHIGFGQFGSKFAKGKVRGKLPSPSPLRVMALVVSALALVYFLDSTISELWRASAGNALLGLVALAGLAASALALKSSVLTKYQKSFELPL